MRSLMLTLLLSPLLWAQLGIVGKVQLTGGTVVRVTNHVVVLSWNVCTGASSYNVYRSSVHGGPYTKIIAGAASSGAIDQKAQHGATYYYVITSINSQGESGYSNETMATIP